MALFMEKVDISINNMDDGFSTSYVNMKIFLMRTWIFMLKLI